MCRSLAVAAVLVLAGTASASADAAFTPAAPRPAPVAIVATPAMPPPAPTPVAAHFYSELTFGIGGVEGEYVSGTNDYRSRTSETMRNARLALGAQVGRAGGRHARIGLVGDAFFAGSSGAAVGIEGQVDLLVIGDTRFGLRAALSHGMAPSAATGGGTLGMVGARLRFGPMFFGLDVLAARQERMSGSARPDTSSGTAVLVNIGASGTPPKQVIAGAGIAAALVGALVLVELSRIGT